MLNDEGYGLSGDASGNLYLVDSSGLYKLKKGSKKWVEIINGKDYKFSKYCYKPFIVGDNNEIYLRDENGEFIQHFKPK